MVIGACEQAACRSGALEDDLQHLALDLVRSAQQRSRIGGGGSRSEVSSLPRSRLIRTPVM